MVFDYGLSDTQDGLRCLRNGIYIFLLKSLPSDKNSGEQLLFVIFLHEPFDPQCKPLPTEPLCFTIHLCIYYTCTSYLLVENKENNHLFSVKYYLQYYLQTDFFKLKLLITSQNFETQTCNPLKCIIDQPNFIVSKVYLIVLNFSQICGKCLKC